MHVSPAKQGNVRLARKSDYPTDREMWDKVIPMCRSQHKKFDVQYLHSHGINLQWSIRKLWQVFSNECHWSCDRKIDIDFLYF